MAFSLGSLYVDLKANTADFVSGMAISARSAKDAGKDIEEAFVKLGSLTSSVFGYFGPLGIAVRDTLDSIGVAAGSTVAQFGKMGGAMGTIAAVGGGLGAALGAAEIGAIALAVHTAESINKMHELAQATGVPIEALSAFSFVAKQNGVDSETMAKGLEKLSKSAFTAATAPVGTTTAFTRLGIAVRDAAGNIRPVQDIFTDISAKFAAMPDGVTKTALAIQLFGRGGAALIPVLNQGREGIQGMIDTAKSLGIVIDDQTAAAAHQFELTLGEIKAGADGASISLTKELLPSLQAVATMLADGLKDKSAWINELISGLGFLTKIFLATGDTIYTILRQVGIFIGNWVELIIEGLTAVGKVSLDVISGNFKDLLSDSQDGYGRMKAVVANFIDTSKNAWKSYADFTRNLASPAKIASEPKRPGGGDGGADIGKAERDTVLDRIKERIAALQQETADWLKIGAAGSQAEALVTEALKKGNEEFGKLRAEAAKSKSGTALPEVLRNEDQIRAAGQASVFGAAVRSLTTDLDKQTNKLQEEDIATVALGAAYKEGGAAIANAKIAEHFADQIAKINVLNQALPLAKQQFGENSVAVKILSTGLKVANDELARSEAAFGKIQTDKLTAELNAADAQFAALKPKIDAVNASYLQGADAVRQSTIALQLQQFLQAELDKGVVASKEAIEQKRKALQDADAQAYQGMIAQEAAQFSLNALYEDQIVKLQRVRDVIRQSGQSTILIDAQILDAQEKLTHQWDEAAFKVGTFSQKFKGVMNELVIEGKNAGAAIMQAIGGAIDGIETNLAKLFTGQKTNFKAVFQNLAEQVTKAQIQKGVGALAEHIPGLGGLLKGTQPLGSSASNPMFVALVNASVPFGAGNPLAGFGLGSDAPEHGGFLSSFLGLFGGGRASGGEMSPGKWYIAGEHGPEPIWGGGGAFAMGYGGMGGGRSQTFNNTFNYNHSADRDLFGRTDRQHANRHMRNLRMAYGQ